MFNPYSCRPIGSGRFEEHLKDIQTTRWYETELQEERTENVSRLCENCHAPWYEKDPKEDPWANLAWAIVISAFIDYLDEYEHKIRLNPATDRMFLVYESRCIYLENSYFRGNPALEQIFDKMLIHVCWQGIDEIQRCKKRLMSVIGWTKRPDTIKQTREERAAEKQAAAEERFKKLFAQFADHYDFSDEDFGPEDLWNFKETFYENGGKSK